MESFNKKSPNRPEPESELLSQTSSETSSDPYIIDRDYILLKRRCFMIILFFVVLIIISCVSVIIIITITNDGKNNGSTEGHKSNGTQLTTQPKVMVISEPYGVLHDGRNVTKYTLRNDHMQVGIINYGGIVTEMQVPDKDGNMDDIILGYDSLQEHVRQNVLLGAVVGRYSNLIAGNRFRLDGVWHFLDIDDDADANGSNSRAFSKRLWNSSIQGDTLVLTYYSPDDEGGFPGNVNASLTYHLTEDNELVISYKATTSKATVINLTNRSFFNLNGHASGSLNDHTASIDADYYTPLDTDNVPTGEIASVDGTLYDVRANTPLCPRLPRVPGGCGFDTNFVFGREEWDKHMARVTHTRNGRTLDIYSTEPGLQFNTGYHLQGIMGKGGVVYKQYGGLSLEAQHYPNSPNEPRFPSTIVRPDTPYTQTTQYIFGVIP